MASKTQKAKAKALAISTDTYNEVYERDGGCVLCQRLGIHPSIKDFMPPADYHHYIPKARSGMGIARNLIMLCRYHHKDCNKWKEEIEAYFKECYSDWNKEELVFKKEGVYK